MKLLVSQSAGRIVILAGGGLDERNIPALVAATGLREVHASMRSFLWGAMQFRKEGVYMGGEKRNDGCEAEYGLKGADEQRIRLVVQQLCGATATAQSDAAAATSSSPQQQQQQQT